MERSSCFLTPVIQNQTLPYMFKLQHCLYTAGFHIKKKNTVQKGVCNLCFSSVSMTFRNIQVGA